MLIDENTEEARLSRMTLEEKQAENNALAETTEQTATAARDQDEQLELITVRATLSELSLMATDRYDGILEQYGVEKPKEQPHAEDASIVEDLASQVEGINPALAKTMRDSVLREFSDVVL
jgi:hypothetical protein